MCLNTSLIWGGEFFAGDKIFWKFLIIIQIFTTQPMLKTFIILPLKIVFALWHFSGHFLPSTHCILDQYCSLSSFESVTDNLETIKLFEIDNITFNKLKSTVFVIRDKVRTDRPVIPDLGIFKGWIQ